LIKILEVMQSSQCMDIRSLPRNIANQIVEFETPFFLFDLDKIVSNIHLIHNSLNPDQIFFALKSNSLTPVLETISRHGCGFEANNVSELEKAIDPVMETLDNNGIKMENAT